MVERELTAFCHVLAVFAPFESGIRNLNGPRRIAIASVDTIAISVFVRALPPLS